MSIKYKERPSDELINKCERKIEQFLKAYNVSVDIVLLGDPIKIPENAALIGAGSNDEYRWIDYIVLKFPDGTVVNLDALLCDMYRIDDEISDIELWNKASCIQDRFYEKQEIAHPGREGSFDSKSPYWRLWEDNKELLGIN